MVLAYARTLPRSQLRVTMTVTITIIQESALQTTGSRSNASGPQGGRACCLQPPWLRPCLLRILDASEKVVALPCCTV